MKYVEQIKSFLLAFLVLLSITLTLLIWNYKPEYELIEETHVEEVLIGDQKQLQDVIKPYRVLYRENDQFTGTISNNVINEFYRHLITWQAYDMELINNNISDMKMNEILSTNNRATLFFNEEIPLKTFSKILTFYGNELPDASFTRLLLDWSNIEQNQLQLLFLNTEKRLLFRSYVDLQSNRRLLSKMIEPAKTYTPYTEIKRDSLRSLYVVQNPIEATQYTYLDEELPIESFKNIVFTNPSIVQPSQDGPMSKKYSDDMSWMQVDTQNRILNYVYPPVESIAPIPSTKLIFDSFEYVNEHGGFTSDFRLSSMNIGKHIVDYRLFLHGYPVYSNVTETRISTTWGENSLFRYRRPYYAIGSDVPNERSLKNIPSGQMVVDYIRNSEDYDFEEVDEIVMGYHLIQNPDAYIFDPSWFVISNNVSKRITPEQLGGVINGLE